MAKKRNLQPANPIHPGEMLLEEFLVPAGKSQAAFAREIGWTRVRLNEFITNARRDGRGCARCGAAWKGGTSHTTAARRNGLRGGRPPVA